MNHLLHTDDPSVNTPPSPLPRPSMAARRLIVGYEERTVIDNLDVDLLGGEITTIIGANGCGKSTLLRAMSQLIPKSAGEVYLNGTEISTMKRKDIAQTIGILPQTPLAPEGIRVADLVSRGRHPHQSWMRQWSSTDEHEVRQALELTGSLELAARTLDSLSGGQRQRVWISMVLAQDTDILFLDEPTTYLDLATSVEILELVQKLRRELNRTVVMVLHDLNLAIRYSDNLIVMKNGEILASGHPVDVISPHILHEAFALNSLVITDPVTGGPLVVPR